MKTIEDRFDRGDLVVFSPDGRYFSIVTEEGLLEQNVPEDTIWIFNTQEVQRQLHHSAQDPSVPVAQVRMATNKDGPIIKHVRWLNDSSGVAFLAVQETPRYRFHQLFVANIKTHVIKPMTPDDEDVLDFDVRGANYIYESAAPEILESTLGQTDQKWPQVLTGLDLFSILFPPPSRLDPFDRAGLWAGIDGVRFQVKDSETGNAIQGTSALSLSPDGNSLVAILKAKNFPERWRRYKEPSLPGRQDWPPDSGAYHLVDLKSGRMKLLVDAPSGRNQHYWNTTGHWFSARWSDDGTSVLLSNTFLPLDVTTAENEVREKQPCTAVVRIETGEITCVLPIKSRVDKERYAISDFRFEDDRTVQIDFDRSYFMPAEPPSATFHQNKDGSWRRLPGATDPVTVNRPFYVKVSQGINEPPEVLAENKSTRESWVIWNPNPQLQDIKLGQAEIINWKDASGFEWKCGLLKPPDFVAGRRYPLVLQTHGFNSNKFLSNGPHATAFAARALAAAGFLVLQMPTNDTHEAGPNEGVDQIAGFERAVKMLDDRGLVDSRRVGIIGFSRTVYHVLETLTKGKLRFAAASLTDGATFSYFEYVLSEQDHEEYKRECEQIYGDTPFTPTGLARWVVSSPGFSLYNVETPVLLVQPGKAAVLSAWDVYAALRALKKPVDLVMLSSGTHVMTNPQQRLSAESINVDWFRFWLCGEEDSDPRKIENYRRWRQLRRDQSTEGIRATSVPQIN